MIFEDQHPLSKGNMTLHILNKEHEDELTALAAEKIIWEYAPEQYYHPKIFKEKWFDKAIEQMEKKERVCFVILYKNEIVGSSSYYEIDLPNKKTNIGYTWFHPSTWGTSINAHSKFILLEYAFEILKLNRVGFLVDSLNERSCRSLRRNGMTREGVLRHHLVHPDRIRDTVVFSVINNEWEIVKEILTKNIGMDLFEYIANIG